MTKSGIIHAVIILAFLFASCSDRRPENVAGESKMVKIMADMETAEAYMQSDVSYRDNPEMKEGILEYILHKNGVSRQEFDSTLSWYGRNIDKYEELYAKVDKELDKRGKKISGNIREEISNDLWPYVRQVTVSPLSSSDNLVFNIPGNDVNKGEKVQWKLHMRNMADGYAMLGVTYEDGASSYISQPLGRRDNLELSLQTDTGRTVKSVFGNLRFTDPTSFPIRIDSITLSALPFDSIDYYRINSTRRYFGPQPKSRQNKDTDQDSISNIAEPMLELSAVKAQELNRNGNNASSNTNINGIRGKKISRRAADASAGVSEQKSENINLRR